MVPNQSKLVLALTVVVAIASFAIISTMTTAIAQTSENATSDKSTGDTKEYSKDGTHDGKDCPFKDRKNTKTTSMDV